MLNSLASTLHPHGSDALNIFDQFKETYRSFYPVTHSLHLSEQEMAHAFAMQWAQTQLESFFPHPEDHPKTHPPVWATQLIEHSQDPHQPARLFTQYVNILQQALLHRKTHSIEESFQALQAFHTPDQWHHLSGYFQQANAKERRHYLITHRPTLLSDALQKSTHQVTEPLQAFQKTLLFLNQRLSIPSKIIIGSSTILVGSTLAFSGLGLTPFLTTGLGSLLLTGIQSLSAGQALFKFQKELLTLPRQLVFFQKKERASFSAFPLTPAAHEQWIETVHQHHPSLSSQELQHYVLTPEDPLFQRRAALGFESYQNLEKTLIEALASLKSSPLKLLRCKLALRDQPLQTLISFSNFIQQSPEPLPLHQAIAAYQEQDPLFDFYAHRHLVRAKVATQSAHTAACIALPLIFAPAALLNPLVEATVDVASFTTTQALQRKMERWRSRRTKTSTPDKEPTRHP